MIVVCPDCNLRYDVDDADLGESRLLRCAGCGAGWRQTAPRTLDAVVTSVDGQTVDVTAVVSTIERAHERELAEFRPRLRMRSSHRRLLTRSAVAAVILIVVVLLMLLLMPDQEYGYATAHR